MTSLPDTPTPTTTMLDAALAWANDGWAVFPLAPGTKVPLFRRAHQPGVSCPANGRCGKDGHGVLDATRDPDTIRRWWTAHPKSGIGGAPGELLVVFDIDIEHGADLSLPFPPTRTHLSGRGNGNRHLVYRVGGALARALKPDTAVLGPGVDVRAGTGSYVVLPPTPHEATGAPYQVEDPTVEIHTLSDSELEQLYDHAGVRPPTPGGGGPRRGGGAVGTMLSELLTHPPAEGARNTWLAKVAGHYAQQYANARDLYDVHVEAANRTLTPPLPAAEVAKTAESIWQSEHTSGRRAGTASETNGYLQGDGRTLQCQTLQQVETTKIAVLANWGDFDITARGVAVDENAQRTYWVTLHWGGQDISTTLPADALGDDRTTRKWLAGFGASVSKPPNAHPDMPVGVRLLRYLNSQQPPVVEISPTLGWDDVHQVFITHDGGITKDGPVTREESAVVADPALVVRDVAPYLYGFERDRSTAVGVLREVLQFQDPTVVSVFGAWWAACLLKPQLQDRTSLFPFFGVEAASESGKTTGFFDHMVQLGGNTRGHVVPTRPVLRDNASATTNGIVWVDDLDELTAYGEILRASTANGTASKMDVDRRGVKNTRICAPILVTGEQLGFDDQKALADRAVVLVAPSPKDRKSVHGNYPQWEDVLRLQQRYPRSRGGLAVLAGWFVQDALRVEDQVMACLQQVKRVSSGRHADKLAVLRVGARLLDHFVGEVDPWSGGGQHARQVETWAVSHDTTHLPQDNTLTLKILPWALRQWGLPGAPEEPPQVGRFAGIVTPAFVRPAPVEVGFDDDPYPQVWVSTELLADAWARDRNHRVKERTETASALRQQLNAIGQAPSKPFAVLGTGRKQRYRRLPGEYAQAVVERVGVE